MKELIQRKIYPLLVVAAVILTKSRLDASSATHRDIVRLRKPNTALLIDHSPCRTAAVPCLGQLARGCYAPFGQHQGFGGSCLSSKSDCFGKSATCKNRPSRRLRRVNWAHDPVSSGFSLLVAFLLSLPT